MFSTVLFSAVVFIVYLFVLAPITSLTKVAKAIKAGDLGRKARVSNRDEIGELAVSFNDMTDRLNKSLEDLKKEKDGR